MRESFSPLFITMITDTFDPSTKEILKPENLTGGRKDMKGPVFSVFDEKTEKKEINTNLFHMF